jgi:hypothetical protein
MRKFALCMQGEIDETTLQEDAAQEVHGIHTWNLLHSRLFLQVADADLGFFPGCDDFRLVRHARFLAEALQLIELFLGRFVIHGVTYAV